MNNNVYVFSFLCGCSSSLVITFSCSLSWHQSFRSLEHLRNRGGQQPYLLAVGRQKSQIDNFYIAVDKHLIPCQTNHPLRAFDELFKAHFVFNLSYDTPLANFYTFLQTTVYNIDVGKMKESPRVRDLRARLLNQPVPPL